MSANTKPFGLFERMLAGRYLRARRQKDGVALISLISFFGIMLAVMVLIVTMSVMNGFRETLLSRILGVNGHVFVDVRGLPGPEIDRMMAQAARAPGVISVAPVINEQGLATIDGFAQGVIVRGVRRQDLEALTQVTDTFRPQGSLANFEGIDAPTIVIGGRLADALGVAEGMSISILSPKGAMTPFGVTPRRKAFQIGAIFEVGMAEFDSGLVYMPIEQAQILFGRASGADEIEIRIADADRSHGAMVALRDLLGPTATITDWRGKSQGLSDALVVERNVMRLILMMIVAIAALNIVSGLVMLVKNKSRDIAILRTMGASQGTILRVFVLCGAAVGVAGTLAGLVLGVGICLLIGPIQDLISTLIGFDVFPGSVYSLDQLPAKLDWGEVALVTGWALLMSFLATLPTAWRASKLDPVEALRYE
jgi:lipoprotein-releasing system permease protein